MVEVMRYAVVTQACRLSPLRSSAMVRIDVATIVWSRAARNIPDISPARMMTIWRWVKDDGAPFATAAGGPPTGVVVVMRSPGRTYGGRGGLRGRIPGG